MPWWSYTHALVVTHACPGGHTRMPWWSYTHALVVIHACPGGHTRMPWWSYPHALVPNRHALVVIHWPGLRATECMLRRTNESCVVGSAAATHRLPAAAGARRERLCTCWSGQRTLGKGGACKSWSEGRAGGDADTQADTGGCGCGVVGFRVTTPYPGPKSDHAVPRPEE